MATLEAATALALRQDCAMQPVPKCARIGISPGLQHHDRYLSRAGSGHLWPPMPGRRPGQNAELRFAESDSFERTQRSIAVS